MNVWLLPIEPFEQRYTVQWLRWFTGPQFKNALGCDVVTTQGQPLTRGIERGQWLDVFGTHFYKATQLAEMVRRIRDGDVQDGDVVLMLDAWNPAVASLAYMRDAGGIDLRIVGLLHAGTWDPHDYLTQAGFSRWARPLELGMLKACDALCVATEFHATLLRFAFGDELPPLRVTGFPLYASEFGSASIPWCERERLVLFPHRLAPEKQPEIFERIEHAYRMRYPDDVVRFVRTFDVYTTKAEYYQLLGRARVAFSSALQETWGICMLESALLGAWPVAPRRLAYPETLPASQLYDNEAEAVELVRRGLEAAHAFEYDQGWRALWETALDRIAAVCKEVS